MEAKSLLDDTIDRLNRRINFEGAGPCLTQADLSNTQAGPSHAQAGPCLIQADLSNTQAGPSHTQAGPCFNQAGPSHDQAGPSQTQNMISLRTIKFHCEECQKVFSSKRNLIRHMQSSHGENPTFFECKDCGKRFIRKDYLKMHVRTIHSNRKPEFPCFKCGKTFSRLEYKNRHCRIYCPSRDGPLSVDTGDESAAVNVDTQESKLKTVGLPIECEQCQKVFSSIRNLKRHRNTTHEKNPNFFECNHCGRHFLRKDTLQLHIAARHSNSEPGCSCPKCGKTFKLPNYRNRHCRICYSSAREQPSPGDTGDETADMDVEEGAQSYPTVVETGSNTELSEQPSNLDTGSVVYTCPKCRCEYSRKASLTRHLKRSSCYPTPLKCPHCDYQTFYWSTLKRHASKHHRPVNNQ